MNARPCISLILSTLLVVLLPATGLPYQQTEVHTQIQVPIQAQDPFVLADGTPLKLKLSDTLTSATAVDEQEVVFEVREDVLVQGRVVIARGSQVVGTVIHAQAKRRMGRSGKLDVKIDFARLTTGGKVSLRGAQQRDGGGNQGKMVAAMAGTALLFWPAAPLFLLVHGKDITIPKGTPVNAFVDGDVTLNPAKFKLPVENDSTAYTNNSEIKAAPMAPPAAASAPTGPKLTNADIIALKQAGFGDDVMIAKIKASGADHNLEVNNLVELKSAGISEPVIAAMLQASGGVKQ
jgi:hypothetical protein